MTTFDLVIAKADLRWGPAFALLQAGFSLPARAGVSARDFMRESLRFPDDYIEGTVSTVFLDDKPVDDIDAARLFEGSRIALSAAMPGLVGAVMRRHSFYASFREAITYKQDGRVEPIREPGDDSTPEIRVTVKLFNSVMIDRGPDVLAHGIILDGERVAEAANALALDLKPPATEGGGREPILLRISESEPVPLPGAK